MSFMVFSLNVWNLNGDYRARMKRLDEYLGDRGLRLVTLDRTNDGRYYAFLTREFI